MEIRANCKINLGLDVLRRRDDGFHELATVMFPVSDLYDIINIELDNESDVQLNKDNDIKLITKGLTIDCPAENNICVKAYRLMQSRYGISGIRITLDKRVPFGAGLGGGSSDATAIIIAINALFKLNLCEAELLQCASELGSDTAFFIYNTPQICRGRGEIMSPIDINLQGYTLVIIKPQLTISTYEAYSGIHPSTPKISLVERISRPIEEWANCIGNNFERHIFASYPQLAELKADLINQGAIYASMSGSGSALFGIFPKNKKYSSPSNDLFIHVQRL